MLRSQPASSLAGAEPGGVVDQDVDAAERLGRRGDIGATALAGRRGRRPAHAP